MHFQITLTSDRVAGYDLVAVQRAERLEGEKRKKEERKKKNPW